MQLASQIIPSRKKFHIFVRKTDVSMGNIAVFEYKGKQPRVNNPHGNAKSKEEFVRTNPKAFDKIQLKIKNNQQPREIFADLKQDDSLTCPRDFGVIRSKKKYEKKKDKETISTKSNIADEILEVIGMVNENPYVQSIVHNKDQVPSIICYTPQQMTDLRHFLTHEKSDPLGIDRTFNLGSFYVTTIVYKNQRVVRKESNRKQKHDVPPIFMGPVLLHKEATYKVYKTFLEHVATEVDNTIDSVELRVSEKMEFGSDDERALTKAIVHVFPGSEEEKQTIFQSFLCDKKKQQKQKYITSKDGIISVPNRAQGTAKKPQAKKRPLNVRTKKRW